MKAMAFLMACAFFYVAGWGYEPSAPAQNGVVITCAAGLAFLRAAFR